MKNKNTQEELPMKPKKFRTLYDTQGYIYETHTGSDSPTDPSEYIPTETLVQRFLRGDILSGISSPVYEFTDDITDEESVENNFQASEEVETINEQLKNHGAETLRRVSLKLSKKMSQKKPEKKDSTNSPSKESRRDSETEAEAEGEAADKPVKPGASDKPSRRDA